MAKLVPVTQEQFGGKRWLRFENYRFASHDPVVPVAASEIARAALAMPLAFLQLEGRYTLVAVQSLLPQQNMFVAADGRWLGFYVPALYRGYPFRLLRKPDSDELVLCVDEESGLVVDGTAGGEEFFDKDGNASAVLKSAFEFLVQFERGRKAMEQPVAALAEAGVIQPWQIKLGTDKDAKPITGLYAVNEPALTALPDEAFLKLRKVAALTLAYAQMVSMGNLGIFERLTKLHGQPAPPSVAALPEILDGLLEKLDVDTIRFN
jgi:hypothetical protein